MRKVPRIRQPAIVEHPDGTLESTSPWVPLSRGNPLGAQMHVRMEQDRLTLDIQFSQWHPELHALAHASPDQLATQLPLPVPLAARFLILLIARAAEAREQMQKEGS